MGTRARAAVLCLAVPGLAAILTPAARTGPAAPSVLVRYAVFALGSTVLARAISSSSASALREVHQRAVALLMAAGVIGYAGVLWLPRHWHLIGVTVFGAAAEELIFRRELPAALAALLGRRNGGTSGTVAGLLLAQSLFACCHFLVPESPRAFSDGAPFVMLLAAGMFLAILYRASGTLLLPITLHAWINVRLRTGALPSYSALGTGGVLACAALAVCGLIAFELTVGRRRAPPWRLGV